MLGAPTLPKEATAALQANTIGGWRGDYAKELPASSRVAASSLLQGQSVALEVAPTEMGEGALRCE